MKEKIYLIPGLMTDERLWTRLVPFLTEYEIIHVPIPHSEDFDDIIDFLFDYFKEDKINILGFSLGGYIASYFAVTYPQRINRLFMVSSTPGASNEAEIQRRKEKFVVIEKNGFEGLSYEKAKSLLEDQNKEDEELIKIIQDMFYELGKNTFISQLTSTFYRKDLLNDLLNLKLPIWFFYNTGDRLLNHDVLKKLLSIENNMKIIKREAKGHNIPLEVPYELSEHIKKWMN